jgi:hypothetical protein
MRRATVPGDLHPYHHDVASRLVHRVPDTILNGIYRDWGSLPFASTIKAVQSVVAKAAAADTAVRTGSVSSNSTWDNVGTLFQQYFGVSREELSTGWHHDIRETDLPVLLNMDAQRYRSLSSEWLPMEHTGLHTAGDFVASLESDMFLRKNVQAFFAAVDRMGVLSSEGEVPYDADESSRREHSDDAPNDTAVARSRNAGTPRRLRSYNRVYKTQHLTGAHVLGTVTVQTRVLDTSKSPWQPFTLTVTGEEDHDANVNQNDDATPSDALPSIWERGVTVHPELPLNFSKKEVIAFIIKLVARRRWSGVV